MKDRHPEVVIVIDREACMGAQECADAAPTVFRLDSDGKSTVGDLRDVDVDAVVEAAGRCPNFAISVEVDGHRRV